MIRVLLWLIIIFIVVKFVRIIVNMMQHGRRYDEVNGAPPPMQDPPRFEDIQDAEFEDLTPPPPPEAPRPDPPPPQPPDPR